MDVWVKTRELIGNLANVTESGSKVARYKIEVANLDRKLGLAFRKVGERAYLLHEAGGSDIQTDPEVNMAFDEVRKLRHRMEAIHREVERHTAKAGSEFGKASKLMKDGAGRTAERVKREAVRAAAVIKEETGRAANVFKKAVLEKKPDVKRASPVKKKSVRKPG